MAVIVLVGAGVGFVAKGAVGAKCAKFPPGNGAVGAKRAECTLHGWPRGSRRLHSLAMSSAKITVRERIAPEITASLFSNYRSSADAVMELVDNAVDSRLPKTQLQVEI